MFLISEPEIITTFHSTGDESAQQQRTSPPDESSADYTQKTQVALAKALPQRQVDRQHAQVSANAVPKRAGTASFHKKHEV
jgi:hypothetical protein